MFFRRAADEAWFNRLRKKEYARLDKTGQVYLDFTGGNLYPQCLIDKHHQYLRQAVYGNPHSINPASRLSEESIREARKKVLDFFNAGDYYCIFTNNATGALQIVGECYPFSPETHLLLTADNHNSVNGIREYCRNRRSSYTYTSVEAGSLKILESELYAHLLAHPEKKHKLFAFPAQSNVSGVQHSLAWISIAKDQGWDVLLDAASFVPSSKLDLSAYKPDFVTISFYKIFGYPTGIGCLLVKKNVFSKLQKPWFAGGTITLSAVKYRGHFLKQDHEKFENGTVNYLDIPAIANGLDFINAIDMERINRRVKWLCDYILSRLVGLKHHNGLPLIKLYGPTDLQNRGGTFLMNFCDINNRYYPIQYIEQLANERKISLRTGCFCNPGIDELNHGLSGSQLASYFEDREQGDYFDIISFLGQVRGAVRLSVGFITSKADIDKFVAFAETLLNKKSPATAGLNNLEDSMLLSPFSSSGPLAQ